MDNLKAQFADYALYELGRARSTVDAYLFRLDWLEVLIGKPVEQISAQDVRELRRAWDKADSTFKGLLTALKQFHLWGALEGHWSQNGISLIRLGRFEESNAPPLSKAEARSLLAACSRPLEYRLIYLGLYAGMRIGESARFEGPMWRDVLRFVGEKTFRVREVPVHPELEAAKWWILASRPTLTTTLQRVKRRLATETGITFKSQQLRKTFATTLYDAEVPDRTIKHLLGHSQDVTDRYIFTSRQKLEEAISRLSY